MTKRKKPIWFLEVPERLNELLEDYIKTDSYATKSEFIRTAVRDRLDQERSKKEA